MAFAQYRKWPDDAGIQHKCLVYAGLLAHYAEDSCQPLHTTVDYDGRAGADGKSPHSGIHAKVDALIEKIDVQLKVLAAGLKIHPFEDLWPAILANLQHSHNLVDKTYELEKVFPSRYGSLKKDSPATAFGTDLLETAATFTADIYLTAWRILPRQTCRRGMYGNTTWQRGRPPPHRSPQAGRPTSEPLACRGPLAALLPV